MPEWLEKNITGFEVLAEPVSSWSSDDYTDRVRRETVEAVVDAIRAVSHSDGGYYDHQLTARQLQNIIIQFTGVSS